MRERPIIFSAPMVRAILEGRKTQTRRAVKPQPPAAARGAGVITSSTAPRTEGAWWWLDSTDLMEGGVVGDEFRCPFGQPGDRLWVREAFKDVASGSIKNGYGEVRYGVAYQADGAVAWRPRPTIIHDLTGFDTGPMQFERRPWKPSIHMPRRASRITLEITGVRVERLQAISEVDVRAEGIAPYKSGWTNGLIGPFSGPTLAFLDLWESINGPGSWDANPWVWVIEFRRFTEDRSDG